MVHKVVSNIKKPSGVSWIKDTSNLAFVASAINEKFLTAPGAISFSVEVVDENNIIRTELWRSAEDREKFYFSLNEYKILQTYYDENGVLRDLIFFLC